jgi:hypothetical protein
VKANFILIVLAVVLGLGIAAASAKASTSYYWPSYLKRNFIASCSTDGDVIECGCAMRKLMTRWPVSVALAVDRKATYGDPIPARYMRDMRWAVYSCVK